MTDKTSSIISTVLTIVILLIIAVLSVFFEMLALNGASEKQGTVALGISLICNGLGLILLGLFSGWLTKTIINKFNWNKALAIFISVLLTSGIGIAVSAVLFIISIPLAGIK